VTPDPALARFGHVEFVPLRNDKLLCILVTTDGRIENKLVTPDAPVDAARLDRIHLYLNGMLSGMTLDEVRDRVIRELGEDKHRYDELVAQALRLGASAFATDRSAGVVVSGQANLLDTGDVDKMRELMRVLEDKHQLVRLLDRTRAAEGIQVFLGAETATEALSTASVVAESYGPEDHPIGAIAVIGPMRMNYGKVMSVVDFTADLVSQLLADL
jgi:heat-inducible transcriptional repressor